ncbi:MAG: hypothetical protein IKI15_02300 [Lachnospiraceae bacterium]|nr:hypothetical protein [Lachnospiraceae bacterium]
MDKRARQRICLLLLFGLMLLLGTACGSGTSQDTKPSGEPTKIAEATKPVEPTNTSTPIPTAEPTKPVEPQPVEKLTLQIEGEIHEEKLDKALKEYEDTGVDITVAVDFGNVPPEEAKKAFLEQYPELDHYRVLGITGTDRPEPDELLLKIPYAAAKELTKDDAVASVSLFVHPDNEAFSSDCVTVVGTINGKNVYDALKDPGFRFMTDDERAWADVVYSGRLMVAEFQLADDEFARVVVIPKAKYEPMEERLDLEWKESGVANKNEWLIGEEGEAASRRIQAELIQDSLQILYDAGWIVTEESAVNGLPSFRYLCAIVTGRQLRNLKIPEGATYRYEILFDGLWRRELPLKQEYYKNNK